MQNTTITGHDAIRYAEQHNLTLSKYGDPTEGAREGLTVAEAREIAREDPGLLYVEVAEITDSQIRALRSEAGVAGDEKQVAICDRALDGDEAARRECARVIADAAGQE